MCCTQEIDFDLDLVSQGEVDCHVFITRNVSVPVESILD